MMSKTESASGERAADSAETATGGGASDASVFADRPKALLLVIALSMTVICLVPVWGRRFVPMQDYPQHLLQAQMLSMQNDPQLDYHENFDIRLKLGSYAAFYVLTYGFDQVFPTEVAGKIAVSLYILLTASLVVMLVARSGSGFAPWGVLLFFAVLFNQLYYQGNLNYLYSLPLLLFALIDHQVFSERRMAVWSSLRQGLWQLLLFVTHPFTFLVYIGLAGVGSLLSWRDRRQLLRGLAPAGAGLLLFVIWFVLQQNGQGESLDRVKWMPVERVLEFLGLLFTGMKWQDGVSPFTSVIWIAIGCLMIWLPLSERHKHTKLVDRYALFLLLAILAVLVMPFRVRDYSFINLRMSSIAYFLLAMVCSRIHFRGVWRYVFPVLVLALVGHAVDKQWRISDEIARAEPVITEIPPNARVLPLVFVNGSPELERRFFDTHLHVHNYYHILVGGGFSPYFWRQPMTPAHYKPGAVRPAPGEYRPGRFQWQVHSADYQYFLVRGGPPALYRYLSQ